MLEGSPADWLAVGSGIVSPFYSADMRRYLCVCHYLFTDSTLALGISPNNAEIRRVWLGQFRGECSLQQARSSIHHADFFGVWWQVNRWSVFQKGGEMRPMEPIEFHPTCGAVGYELLATLEAWMKQADMTS